jgi:hypothetical protein
VIDIGASNVAILEGNHSARYVVSSFYGTELTLADLNIDPSNSTLTFDASSDTQGSGTLYVVSQGESLRPRLKTDPLAAYGQEVAISYVVGTDINIALGRFRITDVPSATETYRFASDVISGSVVELTLADRFDILVNDSFLAASSPQSTSAWDEIQRISPIPVVRSLPDATVPATLVYQNKLDAIKKLMTLMGGEPAMTREGALTARLSTSWALGLDPVTSITGVIERDDGMSNHLFNCIVVTNSNDSSIVGIAQIDDPSNPLCVTGPLGRRVKTVQDPLATTQAAADASARTYLTQYSTQQTQTVKVTCLPRWDIELGDFIQIVDPNTDEEILGTVVNMQCSLSPTAAMSLEITEATQ